MIHWPPPTFSREAEGQWQSSYLHCASLHLGQQWTRRRHKHPSLLSGLEEESSFCSQPFGVPLGLRWPDRAAASHTGVGGPACARGLHSITTGPQHPSPSEEVTTLCLPPILLPKVGKRAGGRCIHFSGRQTG